MHSEKFYKKLDKGIHPLDKFLNIKWPIKKKIMSPKDNKLKIVVEMGGSRFLKWEPLNDYILNEF